jgi:hypothetical protein
MRFMVSRTAGSAAISRHTFRVNAGDGISQHSSKTADERRVCGDLAGQNRTHEVQSRLKSCANTYWNTNVSVAICWTSDFAYG